MNDQVKAVPISPASLYESGADQPRSVQGWLARLRWAWRVLTQAVFYGLPWLSWNGRPGMLFDLAARRGGRVNLGLRSVTHVAGGPTGPEVLLRE